MTQRGSVASYSLQQQAFWLSWDAKAGNEHNLRGKGKYISPRSQKYYLHYMHLFLQLQVTSWITNSPWVFKGLFILVGLRWARNGGIIIF